MREVRFGLSDGTAEGMPVVPGSTNGFAGEPALLGIAPFLTLIVALSGPVDPSTGMLINIKIVDRVLRAETIPQIAQAYRHGEGMARIISFVAAALRERFAPHLVQSVKLGLSPYLSVAVDLQEPNMVHLSQRFEFSAAHRLHADALSEAENWDVFGRCNNPNGHGHNYEIEVTIAGEPDNAGQLMPLHELQKLVNDHVIEVFDHKHLNVDCVEFAALNPTVENIAAVIFGKLKDALNGRVRLARVRVWETPKTCCEISAT